VSYELIKDGLGNFVPALETVLLLLGCTGVVYLNDVDDFSRRSKKIELWFVFLQQKTIVEELEFVQFIFVAFMIVGEYLRKDLHYASQHFNILDFNRVF